MLITDKRGNVLANEIMTEDMEIPIQVGSITATLSVTLDQLEDALGMKVSASAYCC